MLNSGPLIALFAVFTRGEASGRPDEPLGRAVSLHLSPIDAAPVPAICMRQEERPISGLVFLAPFSSNDIFFAEMFPMSCKRYARDSALLPSREGTAGGAVATEPLGVRRTVVPAGAVDDPVAPVLLALDSPVGTDTITAANAGAAAAVRSFCWAFFLKAGAFLVRLGAGWCNTEVTALAPPILVGESTKR